MRPPFRASRLPRGTRRGRLTARPATPPARRRPGVVLLEGAGLETLDADAREDRVPLVLADALALLAHDDDRELQAGVADGAGVAEALDALGRLVRVGVGRRVARGQALHRAVVVTDEVDGGRVVPLVVGEVGALLDEDLAHRLVGHARGVDLARDVASLVAHASVVVGAVALAAALVGDGALVDDAVVLAPHGVVLVVELQARRLPRGDRRRLGGGGSEARVARRRRGAGGEGGFRRGGRRRRGDLAEGPGSPPVVLEPPPAASVPPPQPARASEATRRSAGAAAVRRGPTAAGRC